MKSFRKTNKNNWGSRQGKKQIKVIQDHGKQLLECNKLIKKEFNVNRDSIPIEEQKNNVLKKGLLNLAI